METENSALSSTALLAAKGKYYLEHKINPTTLCVTSKETRLAYDLLNKLSLHYMIVVLIPGEPSEGWYVGNHDGLVFRDKIKNK